MEKITSRKISNWSAWIIKAKGLKDKYDHLKNTLLHELKRNRPSFFGEYDYKRSLILLLLLSKVVRSQELLYHRFINGSKIFLSCIEDEKNKEYLDLIKSVHQEEGSLWGEMKKEADCLTHVSELIKKIDEKSLISLLISGKIDEQKIYQIQKNIEDLPKSEFKKIRSAHVSILRQSHKEQKIKAVLNAKIDRIKSINFKLFLLLKNEKIIGGASLVYIGGYICFFAGLLEYQVFNEVTNLARRTVALGTDSTSLAF